LNNFSQRRVRRQEQLSLSTTIKRVTHPTTDNLGLKNK
jgi:hypothetical protein